METVSPEPGLPVPYARRLDRIAEVRRYVARPGIRALPSGTLAVFAFACLQAWTLIILFWAIWWPAPLSTGEWTFSIGTSLVLVIAVVGVIVLLLRKYPGFAIAALRAPFIRLTVTDRRILWSLPWQRMPLMEIGRDRVLGGILGPVDRRGYGSAALVLMPGDPSADIDGNIHFDRLPNAEAFVAALYD